MVTKKSRSEKNVRGRGGEGGEGVANPLSPWPKNFFDYTKPSVEPIKGFYLGDPNPIPLAIII